MNKVAEAAPQIHGYILKTASEVRNSPFRDEIVQELDGLMKQALSLDTMKAPFQAMGRGIDKLPSSVKWTAGMAGTGVALALAGDMFDALKRGITKGHNYRKMLSDNPDLNGDDPDVIRNFNTLHRFNPEYSADPNVAGAYVRQAKQFSGDIGMVHGLTQARQNVRGARKLPAVALPWQTMGPAAEKTDLEVQRLQQELAPENVQAEQDMRALQMEELQRRAAEGKSQSPILAGIQSRYGTNEPPRVGKSGREEDPLVAAGMKSRPKGSGRSGR